MVEDGNRGPSARLCCDRPHDSVRTTVCEECYDWFLHKYYVATKELNDILAGMRRLLLVWSKDELMYNIVLNRATHVTREHL